MLEWELELRSQRTCPELARPVAISHSPGTKTRLSAPMPLPMLPLVSKILTLLLLPRTSGFAPPATPPTSAALSAPPVTYLVLSSGSILLTPGPLVPSSPPSRPLVASVRHN